MAALPPKMVEPHPRAAPPPRPRTSPFPIPFGWFQIAWPHDIAIGEVKPMHYFGRELAVWRDEQALVHLVDAFCPHLGAHFGHGGTVDDGCLVCPFHGWTFDADGRNVAIPYSERTNRKAALRTYPVIERNGLTMAWYHPDGSAPSFEIPEIDEYASDDFTEYHSSRYTVHAPWQELAENSVDTAHFRYVHGTDTVPALDDYGNEGAHSWMRTCQKFVTPRGVTDVRLDSDSWGPGFSLTWFTGIVDALLVGTTAPIDAATTEIRFNFLVRKQADEASTTTVIDAFVHEINKQVTEDIPVWENKAYLDSPALADTDGPFIKFRKWAAQFYE